jgi:tetratricopeptide (TPR) repeat protein
VGASPKKLLDGALADYFAGQFDLAAMGLESYVRTFPQSPEAPEAQLRAGNSYLQTGKNDKAVEAYDVVIRTYSKSSSVPEAYAKKGIALINLKQYDRAREALEYVVKNYPPDNAAAGLAQGDPLGDFSEGHHAQVELVFGRAFQPGPNAGINPIPSRELTDDIGVEQPASAHISPSSRIAASMRLISTPSSPRAKKLDNGSRRRSSRSYSCLDSTTTASRPRLVIACGAAWAASMRRLK